MRIIETDKSQDFSWTLRNELLVVQVNTRRATGNIAPALKERLLSEIKSGNGKIIVNLSYVEFVDSSFLGSLVSGMKNASPQNGEIKITGLHPHVRMTFEVTHLDKVFKLYDTVEEAIRDF